MSYRTERDEEAKQPSYALVADREGKRRALVAGVWPARVLLYESSTL